MYGYIDGYNFGENGSYEILNFEAKKLYHLKKNTTYIQKNKGG